MIYMLFAVMLVYLLFSLYVFNFEIMSPSVISTAMFSISTAFACLNKNVWNIDYSLKAFLLLTSGVLVIIVTEVIVKMLIKPKKVVKIINVNTIESRNIDKKVSMLVLIVCTLFLLLYVRDALKLANGSASIFGGSVFNRINKFYKLSLALGLEGGVSTLCVQLGKLIQSFSYIYIFKLINNLACGQKVRDNLDSIYMGILYFVLVLFQGTRTPLLSFAIFIFLMSYVKNLQLKNWKTKKKQGKKYIKYAALIVIVGIPCFFLFGEFVLGRNTGNSLWQYISAYIGGSIQHFNQYVNEPIQPNKHFGEEFFVYIYRGLYKFGLTDYTRTAHLEYRWLSSEIHGNVYTFFRRPLQDFGAFGMYLITSAVFGFFSYLYYKIVRNISSSLKNDKWLFLIVYIYTAIVYVSIDGSTVANLISIGNIVMYVGMYFCYELIFKLKIAR